MTFDTPELTRHRVRLARNLSFVGFAGMGCALIAAGLISYFHPLQLAAFATLPYLLSIGGWGASFAVWFARFKRPAVVSIDAGGVSFSTASPIPRAAIASAYVIERPAGTTVEIVEHDGDVHAVVVPNAAAGSAVVAALGFGPGARRQTIDLGARKRRFLNVAIGFGAYQAASFSAMPIMLLTVFTARGTSAFSSLMFVWVIAVLPLIYRAFKRRTRAPVLEIGDDGMTIRRSLKSIFYPRASIHGAQLVPNTATLSLATSRGNAIIGGSVLDRDRSQAVLDAMRMRWMQAPAPLPRVASFLREGRDLAAWEADLRVRIATAGYRDASGVTVEDADAVLRNPSAPADARIGAALALKAAGQHLRIADAAAPVSDEALREALEAVADGHDEPAKLAKLLQR